MSSDLLFRLPQLAIFGVLWAVLLVSVELGWRVGQRTRRRGDDAARSNAHASEAAMLGLLALLLGFTFTMTAERYEARIHLQIEEAGAIETAYLRADLTPEPTRSVLRDALRDYVDSRLASYSKEPADWAAGAAESERLHDVIWHAAVAAAERAPTFVSTALLVESVNDVIELYARQLKLRNNPIPSIVLWLLFSVSGISAALVGHAAGFGQRRPLYSIASVLLVTTIVIMVIVDLDRPRRGLIRDRNSILNEVQRKLIEGPGKPRMLP